MPRFKNSCYFSMVANGMLFGALCGCTPHSGFFVVPEHLDLGVADDHVAIAEFELVNGTNREITISEIHPSCQCTTVELAKNPIPPGGTTTLRARADLSNETGKQDLFVMFLTDHSAFPSKRVSFEVIAPATGVKKRSVSIGAFYAGDEISVELPASAFSRGAVAHFTDSDGEEMLPIAGHFVDDADKGGMLVIGGRVPNTVGTFRKTFQFAESIPGEPALGDGMVELEITGDVVARWLVKADLYAGFISSQDGELFTLAIEGSPGLAAQKHVRNVSITCDEGWLALEGYTASLDEIVLEFSAGKGGVLNVGPMQAGLELIIEYADGKFETYPSTLFAYVER